MAITAASIPSEKSSSLPIAALVDVAVALLALLASELVLVAEFVDGILEISPELVDVTLDAVSVIGDDVVEIVLLVPLLVDTVHVQAISTVSTGAQPQSGQ